MRSIMLRTGSATLCLALLAPACNDPADVPGQIGGVYELVRIGNHTTFPIYLGIKPAAHPAGHVGTDERWLLGGELHMYNAEYAFRPRLRRLLKDFFPQPEDLSGLALGGCGNWNYVAPQVRFGIDQSPQGSSDVALSVEATGRARGTEIEVQSAVVTTADHAEIAAGSHTLVFRLVAQIQLPEYPLQCTDLVD